MSQSLEMQTSRVHLSIQIKSVLLKTVGIVTLHLINILTEDSSVP